jgi:hypothetical protein
MHLPYAYYSISFTYYYNLKWETEAAKLETIQEDPK